MPSRILTIIAAALLLAAGMAGLGMVASRALRERDRAVRDGVLLGIAQELESEFRQHGPESATAVLESFLESRTGSVAGIELATPAGVVASAGTVTGQPTESKAALGPAWRAYAMGSDSRGFGRGYPPFTFRLYPAERLGQHNRIAVAVVAVSTTAAAALFGLALLAARGLSDRERRLTAEGEQQRLRIAALAGAGLAHRIRTPLATIKGTAQLMESQSSASPERARRIVDEAGRIDVMIRRLLDFARPPEPQPERFDLAGSARAIAARLNDVQVQGPQSLFTFADPVHFETAFEELLANARAFDDGPLSVAINSASRQITVEVRDHGPGLSIDPAQAIEPYVTTRPDGSGLGLSIANALMRSNGGDLSLRNAEGGGCLATIRLPEAS